MPVRRPQIPESVVAVLNADLAKQGVVYFIREGKRGPIKVGFTKGDPADRLERCQTGNPRRLHLMPAVLVGHQVVEQLVHQRFDADRLVGEWFRPTAELVDLANGIIAPADRGALRIQYVRATSRKGRP